MDLSKDNTRSAHEGMLDCLPAIAPAKLTSGVDRYGFSSVLAQRCGRRIVPRSFANWGHGWIWHDEPTAELLACAKLPWDLTIVVCNTAEQLALEAYGFKDVRIGGLPFAYIKRQHTHRQTDSLLAFPPHSAEVERLTEDQAAYMDYLVTMKQYFEEVYVSVFSIDMGGPLHKAAQIRGLRVVQGARPDDANSLLRTRAILDSFTHVTTNCMGSHMIYALFAGCKFSFCGPMYAFDESYFLTDQNPFGHSSEYIQLSVKILSEPYLREKFGRFFVDDPRMGLQDVSFAANSIGERSVMLPHQIEDALGWGVGGQIKGYATGARRRLSRSIISRMAR